jgi:hypothetical protein
MCGKEEPGVPKIAPDGTVSYEPGREPPGWQPPPADDAAVGAAPAPEPPAPEPETAPPPRKRKSLKEQLEGDGGG